MRSCHPQPLTTSCLQTLQSLWSPGRSVVSGDHRHCQSLTADQDIWLLMFAINNTIIQIYHCLLLVKEEVGEYIADTEAFTNIRSLSDCTSFRVKTCNLLSLTILAGFSCSRPDAAVQKVASCFWVHGSD